MEGGKGDETKVEDRRTDKDATATGNVKPFPPFFSLIAWTDESQVSDT